MFDLLTTIGGTESLLDLFNLYGEGIVFVAVFLSGEAAVLASFMLAEQGSLTVRAVFIMATLATVVADMFWFCVGRYFPTSLIPKKLKRSSTSSTAKFLDNVLGKNLFLTVLGMKFVVGMRTVVILYCARKPITVVRFVIYDIVGAALFVGILALVGLVFTRMFMNLVPDYGGVNILAGVLAAVLVVYVVKALIGRRLRMLQQ